MLKNEWLAKMEISNPNRAPLAKREVVGPIVQTPGNIKPVGYKWVIVKKTKWEWWNHKI